jgi:hypothetical protein
MIGTFLPTHRQEHRRESDAPGAGSGRKDEVGRSGVYPMSGPHPAGDVEIKPQPCWGQGERGAAGYEDHGGSELTWVGGQLLGGFNAGMGDAPRAKPEGTQESVEIPHEEWLSFFDSFSRQHLDWMVTVEVASPAGRLIVVEQRRLKGISMDRADGKERVYIQVGDRPEEHITHKIDDPTQLNFRKTQSGCHKGLEVASADGTTTIIRFRSAAQPETLDGITG